MVKYGDRLLYWIVSDFDNVDTHCKRMKPIYLASFRTNHVIGYFHYTLHKAMRGK